jgi:predicted ribosomally synthesized peptide with SipW-like signal peptide
VTKDLANGAGPPSPDDRAPRKTSTGRKLLKTGVVLGLVGILAGLGTWSAFSDTTTNDGNQFTSGTVVIDDDDGGSAIFNLSGMKPSDTDSGCIKVTYTGSLASTVRLYGSTTGSGLDQYLDLKVTRGTSSGSFDSCTGFTADGTDYIGQGAGVVYNGTLQGFPDSYGAGLVDPTSGSPETWTNPETHAYKFQVTLQDNSAAQGKNATQQFTWEARNN